MRNAKKTAESVAATVRAAEDCTVLEMLRNVLYIMQRSPSFRAVLGRNYRDRAINSHLRSVSLFEGSDKDWWPSITVPVYQALRGADAAAGRRIALGHSCGAWLGLAAVCWRLFSPPTSPEKRDWMKRRAKLHCPATRCVPRALQVRL